MSLGAFFARAVGIRPRVSLERCTAIARDEMDGLPDEVLERIEGVELVISEGVSPILIDQGLDPKAKGAFVAEEIDPYDEDQVPGEIRGVLYVFSAHQANEEDVRTTVLHEVGHALGLDEYDVEALGLG